MSDLAMESFEVPLQSDVDKWREVSRKSFSLSMERRVKSSRDDVDTTDQKSFIGRSNLVQTLLHAAFYLRAPPATGKTSLAQLLHMYLLETNLDVLPVLLNCNNFDESQSFEDQFSAKSGLPMNLLDLCNATDNVVVVIIDESQLLYSRIRTEIWSWLKGGKIPDNLCLIFFAAYGEKVQRVENSAPYEFASNAMFGLHDLTFAQEEYNELVSKFCPTLGDYMEANAHIFSSTAGHVGLVTTIFNALDDYSKETLQRYDNTNLRLSEHQVLEFLISPRLADAVRVSRSYALNVQSEIMARIANQFLEEPVVAYDSAQHDALIKSGLLVKVVRGMEVLVSFTAPLIRRAFIHHYLSDQSLLRQHLLTSCDFETPKEFLVACLGSFSKRSLLASNAISARGKLNETKFRLEFFFVARELIGERAWIDPEVGHVLKTADNAEVDFYVNGKYKWAIEFLVESDRVDQHLKRFAEEGGCYKPFPCVEFLVVDFVRIESPGATLRKFMRCNNPGYFRVTYSTELTQFTVENLNTVETIPLLE